MEGRWRVITQRACQRALAAAQRIDPAFVPMVERVSVQQDVCSRCWGVRFDFVIQGPGCSRRVFRVIERVEGARSEIVAWATPPMLQVGRIMREVIADDRRRRREREQMQALEVARRDPSQDNIRRLFTAWTGGSNPPDDYVQNMVIGFDPAAGEDEAAVVVRVGNQVTRLAPEIAAEVQHEVGRLRDEIEECWVRGSTDGTTVDGGAGGGGTCVRGLVPTSPLVRAFTVREPVSRGEAMARGEALLRSELTPDQQRSLDRKGWFEVRGGRTGRRYRIMKGCAQNVYEIGLFGQMKRGLCFAPAGNLVWGDVMLAQKTALELFEDDALAVANEF